MSTDFGYYPRTGWKGLTSMHREKNRSMWEIVRTHVLQWLNA